MQGKESSAFTAKTSEPPTPVRRPQSAHHSLSCLEKLLITVPQATTSSASSPSRPDLISTSVASLGQAIHAPKSTQKHASSLKHTHTQKRMQILRDPSAPRARPQKLQRLQPGASALASSAWAKHKHPRQYKAPSQETKDPTPFSRGHAHRLDGLATNTPPYTFTPIFQKPNQIGDF